MSIMQITITIHYCLCEGEHCSKSACTTPSSTPLATMSSPPTSTSCSASSHFCLFTKAMTNQIFLECLYPVMDIKSRLRDTSFIYMNNITKTIKNTSVMNVQKSASNTILLSILGLVVWLEGHLADCRLCKWSNRRHFSSCLSCMSDSASSILYHRIHSFKSIVCQTLHCECCCVALGALLVWDSFVQCVL